MSLHSHDSCGSCGCGADTEPAPVARVNGIALHAPGEAITPEDLRERAWAELLRQEAVRQGRLPAHEGEHMPALEADAHNTIAAMLDEAVPLREPSADEARRYYDGHPTRFTEGARARLRHILFAVTEGLDVSRLAARAEQALVELSGPGATPGRFAELARELSNCPSGEGGGELGWVTPRELAPELAAELFHQATGEQPLGLRPRLVHSRFGLHVMEVLEREPGRLSAFEDVRAGIASLLAQQSRARVEGVELEAADSPLVQ